MGCTSDEALPGQIMALERPHPALWKYYILSAIAAGPGVLFALPYLYFRYHTLRYRFDEEGIHMRVGILFRREVNLTYARIQDIHLRSNLIQRWFGLANVQIQTASGSAGAELIIEGFKEFEAIRDFLYTRMRGYQAQTHAQGPAKTQAASAAGAQAQALSGAVAAPGPDAAEIVGLLLNIRDELRRTREILEAAPPGPGSSPPPPASPGPGCV